MKPSQVKTAIKIAIKANRPVLVSGQPGVGKSEVIRSVAADLKMTLIDQRAVLLDPVDLRGLPHVNGDNRAHWCSPDFLPQIGRDGARGILFLDELPQAPPLVQSACFQLILDRKLGEYALPDGWMCLAAGNNLADRANVQAMPSPLRNRFVHIDFEHDVDDWCNWAVSNQIRPEIIAFIRFMPKSLHNFDPNQRDAKAFATPRSWKFASDLLAEGIPPEIEMEFISGTVGQGAATEFLGFLRTFRDLPDMDAILRDPQGTPVPTQPAALYAVATALGSRITVANVATIMVYLARLPKEFEVVAMTDAVRRDQNIQQTANFAGWAVKNVTVMM